MTQALQSLLEHAERERDDSLAATRRAEAASQQLRQQMDQLQAYRADYETRSPGHGGRAAPIELLRCHLAFMQRLEQALGQQAGLLQAAELQLLQQRQLLLARETRVAAVRKLVERRAQDQQRVQARRDQNRSDEATAQRHWHDNAHKRTVTH